MNLMTFLALGSVLILVQKFLRVSLIDIPTAITKRLPVAIRFSNTINWLHRPSPGNSRKEKIDEIKALAEHHEVAEKLNALIQKDGAESWPPNVNHDHTTWPAALRPYKEIYLELAPLLPQATPSLDDDVNLKRMANFREQFRELLQERVNPDKVMSLMRAADAGRWVFFPRSTYNAFYCCIASSRHAYRWATIPVVRVAQLEKEVDLPIELIEPWTSMQKHFDLPSESGNNTSNLVLNFDTNGTYIHKINTGMAQEVSSSEEAFARIFYDVEKFGVPVYHDMVHAIVAFAQNDKFTCARHVASITAQMRFVLGSYMDNMHDKIVARSVWLSRIQGFYAWGIGHCDEETQKWDKFDGLSGNQVLLFQALDAFLGIEQYLSSRDQERNVPKRQRELCHALRRHSFRAALIETPHDEDVIEILRNFDEILKRLRLFRAAHRTRAKMYLSQPAPERLPMTAGKSLLKDDIEQSLEFLDGFMIRRLAQTV